MNPEIIKKLNLKPTDFHFGCTFANGITVFHCVDEIYCAACDHDGNFTMDKTILFFGAGYYNLKVTEEFILDTDCLPFNSFMTKVVGKSPLSTPV